MGESRNPAHVALYDSSYVILFDDGSWSSQGLSNKLIRKMKQFTSNIKFFTFGPYRQWFLRLDDRKVFYYVKDKTLRDELKNSTVCPNKLWFNDDDGYVLQYEDLSLSWDNIPINFHNKLNGRQKSLPKVQNITFGPSNAWWVSFEDDTARWSQDVPSDIKKYLMYTECLVLDPVDEQNYFIVQNNGNFKWRVNDDFDEDIKDNDENDDDYYMDPQDIRYTQPSIKHQFSDGQNIDELRHDLEHGITSVTDVPTINVVQTRSGNLWSLDNRPLWCFRQALNIDKIPVHIVGKPSWFNKRIQQLENPFEIRVRDPFEETEFHSDFDDDSNSDDYDLY